MKKKLDYPVNINYPYNNVDLTLSITNGTFYDDVTNEDVVRYLKGVFTNKSRFEERFIKLFRGVKLKNIDYADLEEYTDEERKQMDLEGKNIDWVDMSDFECDDILEELLDIYDNVEPFTYEEAFKLTNEQFQASVFGSINIVEMIKELGHERIKVEGKRVTHKEFSPTGEYLGTKSYDVVYETHKVNCKKLGLEEDAYALRCWCTTTDKEHWLWIEDEYKDSPLEAVASTMRVHANVIPHIKEIKRQGDVLLVETGDVDIKPEGELVPLTADQYFGFLTAQS